MPFGDRLYEVYLMRGRAGEVVPWDGAAWGSIAEILDPLIVSARGTAAVRSTQLRQDKESPNQRRISFGRIGWNEKGHAKWTHRPGSDEGAAEFLHTEVWAPSWTTCEQERRPPDVLLAMRDAGLGSETVIPEMLLAATDWSSSSSQAPQRAAELVAQEIKASLRAKCERPWSYPFGSGFSTNALNDVGVLGPYKPGRKGLDRTLDDLKGDWAPF